MASKFDLKEVGKGIGVTFAIAFLALHILSIIFGNYFPAFQSMVKRFSLAWLVIFLALIVYLVFRLILGMKTFDKRSIFILLIALAILLFVSIYFKLDYGQLFDMSVINSQLASIIP